MNEKSEKTDYFWTIVVLVGITIFLGKYLFSFFSETLPDGRIVTKPVKVVDEDTDKEYYYNLIIYTGDSDNYYYVDAIISPKDGEKIEVDWGDANFGDKCQFGYCETVGDTDYEYNYITTIKKSDLQVSAVEQIQAHPVSLALRTLGFLFFLFLSGFAIRLSAKERKAQA